MAVSTSEQIVAPTFDDIESLKETFLVIAQEPDASQRVDEGGLRLYVKLERLFTDIDFMTVPPLTICLSGLLRAKPRGSKLAILYRELPHHPTTINSSVNHSYVFETCADALVDYRHRVRACPELPELPQQLPYSYQSFQADQGREILHRWGAGQSQPTAGDCGVLFERMLTLLC